jgi:hypothetical protein
VVASTEFEFLANIRRISELGFDSIRIRFGRIRISVSEFEFEFGELYTLFQNSDSPNIREYEFEFELGEFFPTPGLDELPTLFTNSIGLGVSVEEEEHMKTKVVAEHIRFGPVS